MGAFRKSRQRQIILDLLSEMKNHPTAREIFAQVREMGQATVYRNLRILKEQGEIIELSVGPGAKRYDRNIMRHEHFTCRACGRIEDIYPDYRLLAKGVLQKGYQVEGWKIEAFGICRECRRKQKTDGKKRIGEDAD